ncbi:MAG: hypothetical protein EXR79_07470 [Myxococcales bacterium]|nr:hypothetical protein [Myxococcales bacterium]
MTADDFGSRLQAVIAESDGRPMLLAYLGARLRARDPDLDYRALGVRTLREAMARCTSLGTLERDPSGSDWIFVPTPTTRAPAQQSAPEFVAEPWFQHVSQYDPAHQCWFDLASAELQADATTVALEPERYVEVPRADIEVQRQWAHRWSASLADAVAAPLCAGLEASAGMGAFNAAVVAHGLGTSWAGHRRGRITELIRSWAKQHAIDATPILSRGLPGGSRRPPRAIVPRAAIDKLDTPTAAADASALRAFLHAMVDGLADAELCEFPIPLRFALRSPQNER